MGEYRRENVKHLSEKLMGKWARQPDIFSKLSWGRELTYETITIKIGDP